MAVRNPKTDAAIAARFPALTYVYARLVDRRMMFVDVDAAKRSEKHLAEIWAWVMENALPTGYAAVVQWRAF